MVAKMLLIQLTPVGCVELDTKISIWASRIVAGSQNDPPCCLVFADQARSSRG